MSLSSIHTASATNATLRPRVENSAFAKKSFANNQFDVKALQKDTFELSAAAQRKLDTSRTLVGGPRPAQFEGVRAQEAPVAPEVYSRADVTDLLQQWGDVKPGSSFDFNSDGRVDASDLAALLTKIGQAKPEAGPAVDAPFTRADVERLTEAWNDGSDSSRAVNTRYDLDGDGRVDSNDLAELLSRLGSS